MTDNSPPGAKRAPPARCAARRFIPDSLRAVFAHLDRCAQCRAHALGA